MKKLLFLALVSLAGSSMAAQDSRINNSNAPVSYSNDPLSSVVATQNESVSVGSTSTRPSSSGSDASSSSMSNNGQWLSFSGSPSNDPLSKSAWPQSTTSSTWR